MNIQSVAKFPIARVVQNVGGERDEAGEVTGCLQWGAKLN